MLVAFLGVLYCAMRSDVGRQARLRLAAGPSGLHCWDGKRLRSVPWHSICFLRFEPRLDRVVAQIGQELAFLPTGQPRVASVSLLARTEDWSAEGLLAAAYRHYTSHRERPQ